MTFQSFLVHRKDELNKARTRALVRQNWTSVLETEARIEELKLVRTSWVECEANKQQTLVPAPHGLGNPSIT
jgi:hypothetical protein